MWKMILFIALLFCISMGGSCFAQENDKDGDDARSEKIKAQHNSELEDYKPPPNNVMKTSIPALLISQNPLTGELRLGYEFAPWPNLSTMISVSFIYPNLLGKLAINEIEDSINTTLRNNYNNPDDLKLLMLGYRVQIGQKFYIQNSPLLEAPKGLYIGPMISFAETKLHFKGFPDDFVKMTYFSANLMFGYQFIIDNKFAFDIRTGLRYRHNYLNLSNTDKKIDETIEGPFGNKQQGLFYMNQIHFGFAFNF